MKKAGDGNRKNGDRPNRDPKPDLVHLVERARPPQRESAKKSPDKAGEKK